MLQKLSDHIRACYERAASCAEEAKAIADEDRRTDLLRMEASWAKLAKSYEFVQSLEAFLLDADKRRKEQQDPLPVVLIVEETAPVMMVAETCLAEHGYETLSATTVVGALAVIEIGAPIDALFTTIEFAEDHQAGLELAHKAAKRRPGVKVLYSTSDTVTDKMRAFFVEGAAVLEKPYTAEGLVAALSNLLGRDLQPSSASGHEARVKMRSLDAPGSGQSSGFRPPF